MSAFMSPKARPNRHRRPLKGGVPALLGYHGGLEGRLYRRAYETLTYHDRHRGGHGVVIEGPPAARTASPRAPLLAHGA